MTEKEMYEQRIQDLENRLRDTINASSSLRKSQILGAKYDIAIQFAKFIDRVERSKISEDAIESTCLVAKVFLKENMNIFQDENGIWKTIVDGKEVSIQHIFH